MKESSSILQAHRDELHFIKQVIRNMKHLEHMYMQGALGNEKELFGVRNAIANWLYRASKVEKFLNENKEQ